jgi:hypothetical protein
MSFTPLDDDNPFAPPRSVIGPRAAEIDFEADDQADLIRRHHLSHEASIRSLGLLCYFGAAFGTFFAVVGALAALGVVRGNPPPPGSSAEFTRVMIWIGSAVWAIAAVVNFALGFGLRRLQVWSRWTGVVLTVLSLLYSLFAGLVVLAVLGADRSLPVLIALFFAIAIQAYVFYLLVAPKAGVVFSGEYRLIIKKTPHITIRTSLIVKIGFGFVVALLVLGILASAFK